MDSIYSVNVTFSVLHILTPLMENDSINYVRELPLIQRNHWHTNRESN